MTITTTDITPIGDQFTYEMNWSDCKFKFGVCDSDWYRVAEIKSELEKRLDEYITDRTKGFKTSDIEGIIYISK